jgi:hypothetical protein
MSGLPETPQWEPNVYQIEDDDFASGGPNGHPNTSLKQLANRTAYLRKQINAETRIVSIGSNQFVWIPRFTVPYNSFGGGLPSRNLHLGGFLVGQYASGVMSGLDDPQFCSILGIPVFYDFDPHDVGSIAAGSDAGQMSLRNWGHIAWLVKLLGHEIHGPFDDSQDPRDPDSWEYKAEVALDPAGNPFGGALCGCGPNCWSHNGQENGVFDLLGLIDQQLAAPGAYQAGVLEVLRTARLDANVSGSDTEFTIIDYDAGRFGREAFDRWSSEDGLVLMPIASEGAAVEYITYEQLVKDPNNNKRATLVGCTRGAFGTTAGAGIVTQYIRHARYHCLVPGGYAYFVYGSGLNNTTPGSCTFNWYPRFFAFGTRDSLPKIDDILRCGTEDLLITGVNGLQLTVTRGHRDSQISAHPQNSVFSAYPPAAIAPSSGSGFAVGICDGSIRQHEDLEELFLPAAFTPVSSDETQDTLFLELNAAADPVLFRGRGTGNEPCTMLSFSAEERRVGIRLAIDPDMANPFQPA